MFLTKQFIPPENLIELTSGTDRILCQQGYNYNFQSVNHWPFGLFAFAQTAK
jgi:hypothetical protein